MGFKLISKHKLAGDPALKRAVRSRSLTIKNRFFSDGESQP